jgi:hypothetical protein
VKIRQTRPSAPRGCFVGQGAPILKHDRNFLWVFSDDLQLFLQKALWRNVFRISGKRKHSGSLLYLRITLLIIIRGSPIIGARWGKGRSVFYSLFTKGRHWTLSWVRYIWLIRTPYFVKTHFNQLSQSHPFFSGFSSRHLSPFSSSRVIHYHSLN